MPKNLERNQQSFQCLLHGKNSNAYIWKQKPNQWSLLEIICHLYEEEIYDFRTRVNHVLFAAEKTMPSIDPEGWVIKHNYSAQNFEEKLAAFLEERTKSIKWLRDLDNPNWDNTYQHPVFGKVKAKMFLENWLAHDYLHIRQIVKLQYCYLRDASNGDFRYAGDW